MVIDLVITFILVSVFALLVIRLLNKKQKNKNNPYCSTCSSCSIADRCLRLKNKDNQNKE